MDKDLPKTDLTEPIAWNSVESIPVSRNKTWYIFMVLAAVSLIAISILLIKSWSFAVLIVVMTLAIFMITSRPPHTINYAISPKGIYVADKIYDFSEFKAFGVVEDPVYPSIVLLPVKRFNPGLTLYFSPEYGEAIVSMLGSRLPLQEVEPDALDKFINIIKL